MSADMVQAVCLILHTDYRVILMIILGMGVTILIFMDEAKRS